MCFWAAYTLGSVTNLQKTASKSLLKMLQNTLNLSKKNCFYTEIFSIQKSENENLFLTFQRMLKA
jgi:predicted nucleic-acid-binding Zn-ribbon protein